MEEELRRPVRLMNFVSEEQLDEAKKSRGERVEDGPPKALDEDETEFLDNLEMSKKEYEQQIADEEARQLRSFQSNLLTNFMRYLRTPFPFLNGMLRTFDLSYSVYLSSQLLLFCFQAAVAAQSFSVDDLKENTTCSSSPVSLVENSGSSQNRLTAVIVAYKCNLFCAQEQKSVGRKNPPARPLSMIIKVKPQAKKAKIDRGNVEEHLEIGKTPDVNMEKSSDTVKGEVVHPTLEEAEDRSSESALEHHALASTAMAANDSGFSS
ncbi:hypothetical protein NC652_033177 [Populus alba x Populus x berolinensis]|nr:hypothetical protein NC652_033177 [Populus alba x Populus x berolinensis]